VLLCQDGAFSLLFLAPDLCPTLPLCRGDGFSGICTEHALCLLLCRNLLYRFAACPIGRCTG
jgi:hypothetical protein